MDGSRGHDGGAPPMAGSEPLDAAVPPQADPSPLNLRLFQHLLSGQYGSIFSELVWPRSMHTVLLFRMARYVSGALGMDEVGDMLDLVEDMVDGEDDDIPTAEWDYAYDSFGVARGASSEAMAALAEVAVGETRETGCAVCLESFQEGDRIRKMPCSHGFHESCIFEWLRVSRTCPCCRFELPA